MEALQEDKLLWTQVHHPDGFVPTGAGNLDYRHEHPAAGMWALKSQIYKVTAMAHSMWYLIQAVSMRVTCDDMNVGIATIEHRMCSM